MADVLLQFSSNIKTRHAVYVNRNNFCKSFCLTVYLVTMHCNALISFFAAHFPVNSRFLPTHAIAVNAPIAPIPIKVCVIKLDEEEIVLIRYSPGLFAA